MKVLRISKPQKWWKFKNNEPQTKFTGSCKKKIISFVKNSKFYYGYLHLPFKNTFNSSYHANFRLDISHSKTLSYSC